MGAMWRCQEHITNKSYIYNYIYISTVSGLCIFISSSFLCVPPFFIPTWNMDRWKVNMKQWNKKNTSPIRVLSSKLRAEVIQFGTFGHREEGGPPPTTRTTTSSQWQQQQQQQHQQKKQQVQIQVNHTYTHTNTNTTNITNTNTNETWSLPKLNIKHVHLQTYTVKEGGGTQISRCSASCRIAGASSSETVVSCCSSGTSRSGTWRMNKKYRLKGCSGSSYVR